jgi:opacity protein-like surface antigen
MTPNRKMQTRSHFRRTFRALSALSALAAILAVSAAAPAMAQTRAGESGFELGLRLGYALPFGEAEDGTQVDRNVSGAVPIVLEGGYRIGSGFMLGALLQYGFAQVKDPTGLCTGSGNSCSGSVLRIGAQAIYRPRPDLTFAPWLGLGIGYEWLNTNASTTAIGGANATHTYSGIELLTAQVGGELRAGPSWTLSPFASFSLGRFSSASGSASLGGANATATGDITNTGIHSWLMLGLRGAFAL